MYELKRGMFFYHKKYITYNREALKCKITKIAKGVVYYRPFYGYHDDGSEWLGNPYYFLIESFDKYGELINGE